MKISSLHDIQKLILKLSLVLLLCVVPSIVDAAKLSISPSTGVYTTNVPFTVRILVNTEGAAVNAAEGVLSFNPKQLRVSNINQSGSIFNLWTIEPEYSNSAGSITFGGGSPRGYTGSAGTILSVTFVPLGAGNAKVNFTSGSALAADGQGTNVLSGMGSGSFTIAAQSTTPEPEEIEYVAPANTPAAPNIKSSTHIDQDAWYTNTTASFSWTVPNDVVAVRTGLTNSPSSVPTVVYEPPISNRTIEDLEDGEQYLHIQFRNESGWGRVAHYRIAVDTEKPTRFDISMQEAAEGNPEPTLVFDVEDATSPVRRFLIQIDGQDAVEFIDEKDSGVYTLPRLEPGRHSVVVEAFDAAGNSIVSSFAFDIASFEKPIFTEYPERLTAGVVPVIKGSTRPDSSIFLTLTEVGVSSEPVVYELTSDTDGGFVFIPDTAFEAGVYELSAYSIDSFGAQSDMSDPVRIIVSEPGYVVIGSMLISVLSVAIPLVALLLLLILMVVYLVRRTRVVARYITKETKEAETVAISTFARLKETLDTHAKTMAASRRTKKLTAAESELIESLQTELREAERRIRKEIGDVDDIV